MTNSFMSALRQAVQLTLVFLLIVVVAGLASILFVDREISAQIDAELESRADEISTSIETNGLNRALFYETEDRFAIFEEERGLFPKPLGARTGYDTVKLDGKKPKDDLDGVWRVYTVDAGRGVLVVGTNLDDKDDYLEVLINIFAVSGGATLVVMTLKGTAGATVPEKAGQLAGAPVEAYVWPTSLPPESVGFEGADGILALVATSHPDFDDTPLFDEDGDGNLANDGAVWHSHWVVLAPTNECGDGALSVLDIPENARPKMPATWPGLPIYIDSPGFSPVLDGPEITINVAFEDTVPVETISYDGVTSALRVNQNIHAPLLCVADVFDIASGDLSLPGRAK